MDLRAFLFKAVNFLYVFINCFYYLGAIVKFLEHVTVTPVTTLHLELNLPPEHSASKCAQSLISVPIAHIMVSPDFLQEEMKESSAPCPLIFLRDSLFNADSFLNLFIAYDFK